MGTPDDCSTNIMNRIHSNKATTKKINAICEIISGLLPCEKHLRTVIARHVATG